jgi:hypothetical protein
MFDGQTDSRLQELDRQVHSLQRRILESDSSAPPKARHGIHLAVLDEDLDAGGHATASLWFCTTNAADPTTGDWEDSGANVEAFDWLGKPATAGTQVRIAFFPDNRWYVLHELCCDGPACVGFVGDAQPDITFMLDCVWVENIDSNISKLTSDVKILFWFPGTTTGLDFSNYTAYSDWISAGGVFVISGEYDTYASYHASPNAFLSSIGSAMSLNTDSIGVCAGACEEGLNTSDSLVSGLDNLYFACSATITGGTALCSLGSDATRVWLAYDTLGSGKIILSGDTNWLDKCLCNPGNCGFLREIIPCPTKDCANCTDLPTLYRFDSCCSGDSVYLDAPDIGGGGSFSGGNIFLLSDGSCYEFIKSLKSDRTPDDLTIVSAVADCDTCLESILCSFCGTVTEEPSGDIVLLIKPKLTVNLTGFATDGVDCNSHCAGACENYNRGMIDIPFLSSGTVNATCTGDPISGPCAGSKDFVTGYTLDGACDCFTGTWGAIRVSWSLTDNHDGTATVDLTLCNPNDTASGGFVYEGTITSCQQAVTFTRLDSPAFCTGPSTLSGFIGAEACV